MNFEAVYNGVNFTKELIREFETGERLELVRARERQLRAARVQARTLGPARETALGERRWMIDPVLYHNWGRREGYQIWNDERQLRRWAQDAPEIRVEQARRARAPGWKVEGQRTILDQFGRPVG